ncbi:UDP-2,3-diacylglucosamine diphosphatase [Neisseriaceae bacterium ESL0693]|nr:UDP-2,3-diacylglucosamine diphosphatase [Neisseriaceae bacterium ESL0693]
MNQTTIIISDLHLSENTPKLNQLFEHTLQQWQGKIDALYILGDFFDVWVGDDDDGSFISHIKQLLKNFSSETPIYFMHGNRDFLLGTQFANQTGITILSSPQKVMLYGHHYILTHGDELCTRDIPYQQFRAQSRQPLWQQMVLMKPLAERRLLAGQIRQMSEIKKTDQGKNDLSDASEEGINTLMAAFISQPMPALIHGHTHRPGQHQHVMNGHIFQRYVIQDWEQNSGGYLAIDATGVHAHTLTI